MIIFNIILIILLSIIIIFIEIFQQGLLKLNFFKIFNLFFFICYCFVPLLALFEEKTNYIIENNFSILIIFLFYINFCFFYFIARKKRNKKIKKNISIKGIKIYFLFMLVALVLYVLGYGGLKSALKQAGAIYAGYITNGKFSFFRRIIPGMYIVTYIYYIKFLNKKTKNYLLLFFMIFISFYISLLIASRAGIINYIIGFIIIKYLKEKKIQIKYAVLIIPIITLIKYGKAIFTISSYENKKNILEIYSNLSKNVINFQEIMLREFSHPIISVIKYIENYENVEMRYFKDFIYALFSIVPEKIRGYALEHISYLNTYMILGKYESIIPPGIVAYSLYAFGVLGIIIIPFLCGSIFGKLDSYFDNNKKFSNIQALNYYFILSGMGLVMTGDPYVIFQSNFPIFIFILVILFVNFLEKIIKSNKEVELE